MNSPVLGLPDLNGALFLNERPFDRVLGLW